MENLQEATTSTNEATSGEAAVENQISGTEQAPVFDLASVPKFKFDNREWTPDEFKNAYLMQNDYTRKTQAIAEERKYYSNLQSDLEAVKLNPQLASEFSKIYPEKFHGYLRYVLKEQAKEEQTGVQSQNPELTSRLEKLERSLHENEVNKNLAEIDSTFAKLGPKYPLASKQEELILARAQGLVDRGEKMTTETWEKLFKQTEDQLKKIFETEYKSKIKQQTEAQSVAKDAGIGGATPTRAGKQPRTLKEAEAALRQHMGLS